MGDAASGRAHKKFPQDPTRAVNYAAVLIARFFRQKMEGAGMARGKNGGEWNKGGKYFKPNEDRNLGKCIQLHGSDFPYFDHHISELEPKHWTKYWDKVSTWQKIIGCSDLMVAYM